jgi:DNA-binding MarR family transcriptional regulator
MSASPVQNPIPLERQLRQLITYFDLLSHRLMLERPPGTGPELELSRHETRVIMVLGTKGSTIMSDVARVLHLALSTATNTMDKLVGKELVERTRVDEDRRIVQVGLSEKGRRVYQSFLDCQLAMGRNMLEALSPGEREIFLELMAKMTQPSEGLAEPDLEHSIHTV